MTLITLTTAQLNQTLPDSHTWLTVLTDLRSLATTVALISIRPINQPLNYTPLGGRMLWEPLLPLRLSRLF
ncbi:hypothetical protein [Mycobacterium uberis]|uniref:hypothetical protein n=1 Tax=Mycobacterium uberis TaxID=2162698 RepID=UPI000E302835|nr:hypothetical protein [Mycobacterium uberis]